MRSEQSIGAFRAVFGREPTVEEHDQLRQLSGRVPADFANVARQRRFFGDAAGVSSMAMLRDEVQARRGGPAERPMGFVAN